jgi:hypothetical protein
MTAPNTTRSGVGFRHIKMFSLDDAGYPSVLVSTAYAGFEVSGAKSLTVTDPEPRQINHMGDDRVFAADLLPPDAPMTAELTVSKTSDAADALISRLISFTVGEAKLFGAGTDQRGNEEQMAVLVYRQTLDTTPGSTTFGKRLWEFRIFPKALLFSRENSFDENPEERVYTVLPQFVNAHLWGTAFVLGTEGFTQAQMLRGVSEYKPAIVAFNGDNTTTDFLFPTTAPAQATAKITVWVNGTVTTTGLTKAVDKLTFTAAPAANAKIVAFYETA